jgi:putative DNA primase/helicase
LNLDDFGRVADAANHSIGLLLNGWFPNGVVDGAEFCIGSRSGEAGKSMRIRMTGAKAGYWSDFSSDGDAGRDLISLYAYIHGVSQGKACAAVAGELGIQLADSDPIKPLKPTAQREPAHAPADKTVEEKKPRTDWEPVLPVPADAGPYPVAHIKRGKPEKRWIYRNEQGEMLGVIYRFVTSDGGKEVLPCVYARHTVTGNCEWRWISFRDPRPLYLRCAYRPELPVLVVEGEKCVDAAFAAVGALYDVVSWPGGGKAVSKADWSALAGRRVTLWADADAKLYKAGHALAGQLMPEDKQPGMSTMLKLAELLRAQDCAVALVDIPAPGVQPDGWDVADVLAGGASDDDVLALIDTLRESAGPSIDERPSPSQSQDMPAWVADETECISTASSACASILPWKALNDKFIKTERNTNKGCRENVFMALRHDAKLCGIVALDQFSQLQVKRRETPWPSEPGEWTEGDDFHLGLYLSEKYYLTVASIGEIEKAVSQAAREHAFDPVKDYMTACADKWDKVERVGAAFVTHWGAMDSPYVRLISRMFFVGLVMRAFRPGVKHDCAPVFEGGQGAGKSSALAVLGGDWFADTPFRMGEKDGYLSIQGVLIYEIAELEQFNRSEVTAVKAFMSSSNDRYREPYGRRMKNVPRRTCFSATTNEDKYFKDPTGNRRFWPVKVGVIDLDALARDRDQLIGEAVHMMRAKALWYPTRDEQVNLIDSHQNDREIPHEWIGRLYDYCEGLDADGRPITVNRLERVSSRELITRALHIEIGKLGAAKRETMDVSSCMRKLGWTKERSTEGAREYFYVRPVAVEPVAVAVAEDDYCPF